MSLANRKSKYLASKLEHLWGKRSVINRNWIFAHRLFKDLASLMKAEHRRSTSAFGDRVPEFCSVVCIGPRGSGIDLLALSVSNEPVESLSSSGWQSSHGRQAGFPQNWRPCLWDPVVPAVLLPSSPPSCSRRPLCSLPLFLIPTLLLCLPLLPPLCLFYCRSVSSLLFLRLPLFRCFPLPICHSHVLPFPLSPNGSFNTVGGRLRRALLPNWLSPLKEKLVFPTVAGFSFTSCRPSFPHCEWSASHEHLWWEVLVSCVLGDTCAEAWRQHGRGCWRWGVGGSWGRDRSKPWRRLLSHRMDYGWDKWHTVIVLLQ